MGMLQDTMNGMQPSAGGQPAADPNQAAPAQATGTADPAALIKQGTRILYEDNFEGLVQMFQQHGKDGFPQAMATAINGILDRLEKDSGQPLPMEVVAEVGTGLFEILLSDLAEGGVLPDIDKDDVLESIEAIIKMWVNQHQDQVDPQEAQSIMQGMAQELASQGQLKEGDQIVTPSERKASAQQPVEGE